MPENTDDHWAAVKSALLSSANEVVGYVPNQHHKIWLTAGSQRRFEERRKLKFLIVTTSRGEGAAFELWKREKSREVRRIVCYDKKEFFIALIRGIDTTAKHYHCTTA